MSPKRDRWADVKKKIKELGKEFDAIETAPDIACVVERIVEAELVSVEPRRKKPGVVGVRFNFTFEGEELIEETVFRDFWLTERSLPSLKSALLGLGIEWLEDLPELFTTTELIRVSIRIGVPVGSRSVIVRIGVKDHEF